VTEHLMFDAEGKFLRGFVGDSLDETITIPARTGLRRSGLAR